jgi:hypothetical protein
MLVVNPFPSRCPCPDALVRPERTKINMIIDYIEYHVDKLEYGDTMMSRSDTSASSAFMPDRGCTREQERTLMLIWKDVIHSEARRAELLHIAAQRRLLQEARPDRDTRSASARIAFGGLRAALARVGGWLVIWGTRLQALQTGGTALIHRPVVETGTGDQA